MLRMNSVSEVVATKCGSSVLWMQQYAMVRVSLLDVWAAGLAAGAATPVAAGRAAVGTAAAGLAVSAGFDSAGLAALGAFVGWAAGAAGWQASAVRQSAIRTPYRRRVGRILIVESLPMVADSAHCDRGAAPTPGPSPARGGGAGGRGLPLFLAAGLVGG